MSKSHRAKKERRANRKWAQSFEQDADRLQREGKVPAEVITTFREVAALGKTMGTISGAKKLKERAAKPSSVAKARKR